MAGLERGEIIDVTLDIAECHPELFYLWSGLGYVRPFGNGGRCLETRTASTKAGSTFLAEMSQNTVTIPIGQKEPGEFLSDLHSAICQAKMMIFERRELDIGETESYALYVLTDLQQRIVSKQE